MAKPWELKVGDLVAYDIRGEHPGKGYVAGVMKYAEDDGWQVLVSDDAYLGMPINVSHCHIVSRGHDAKASDLRRKYLDKFPGALAD